MAKKIPRKAISDDMKPIKIKVKPNEYMDMLTVPKVSYEIVATVEHEKVFSGMLLPIPVALIHYLTHNELMVLCTIMEETNDKGICKLSTEEFAKRLKMSKGTVGCMMSNLRIAGLVIESKTRNGDWRKVRRINWKTIQHLNDLVDGEDPGVYGRIRRASRKVDISKLTKKDIDDSYDQYVLPPGHDPEEEEIYD